MKVLYFMKLKSIWLKDLFLNFNVKEGNCSKLLVLLQDDRREGPIFIYFYKTFENAIIILYLDFKNLESISASCLCSA